MSISADYRFERKSILILSVCFIMLLILVYCLGMLTGMSLERPEKGKRYTLTAVQSSEDSAKEDPEPTPVTSKKTESELSKETTVAPMTPEFQEVSPEAAQPKLSEPKKE